MSNKLEIKWLSEPEEQDYPAAESYLSLLHQPGFAQTDVDSLRRTKVVQFKSKDIFRASGLTLLGTDNYHVKKDQQKIEKGESLSPLLLVVETRLGKVIIADGYHRLCAVYYEDEDALLPCKIIYR